MSKHIDLHVNRYHDGFESDDIRVIGARRGASTNICFYPENIVEHGLAALDGKLDQHVLFCVQHATVIDNHGGSAAERDRMRVELTIGEPFTIDGFRHQQWMLVDRDVRRFEGDGVKIVPFVAPQPDAASVHPDLVAINALGMHLDLGGCIDCRPDSN